MPELRDLMDDVRGDLTAVRWASGDELRRRVRRRQVRTIAAAVALVTAVTVGAAALSPSERKSLPQPATSPTVDAGPTEIPGSALLAPEDVGAGPDTQANPEVTAQPIRHDVNLDLCFQQRAAGLLAVRPRHAYGQTFLLGTEGDRPDRPFVLSQAVYRLSAPEAFLRDLRGAIESCDGFTQTGEIEQPKGKVQASGQHNWSIIESGFAGDESILVRHTAIGRNVATGEVIGESTMLWVYLRVGDLITVLSPRAGTSADDLRRIATTAAQRLCAAADPGC